MASVGEKAREYAVFGQGRVGANIAVWLELLGHRVLRLSREDAGDRIACAAAIREADAICVAIPDGALAKWHEDWKSEIATKRAIHFSGALTIAGITGYHPLYSFPRRVLPREVLHAIAFARAPDAPPLAAIFPGAMNPDFVVVNEKRALYHALAVLSGNFAAALWNETAMVAQAQLGLPAGAILAPYLAGVVDRFAEAPMNSLTGPVARRDRQTVEANLKALDGEPRLQAAYRAFLALSWPDF